MRVLAIASWFCLSAAWLSAGEAAAEGADPGVVKVVSEPTGAMVYTGSKIYGPTPAFLELAPGKHALIITRDGYAPVVKEVTIRAGKVVRLSVKMTVVPEDGVRVHETSLRGADAGPGTVSVASDPPGLSVFVDDTMVPVATPVVFDLKAGTYELRLEREGAVVYSKTIFVRAGEITEIEFEEARRRRIDTSDPWQ